MIQDPGMQTWIDRLVTELTENVQAGRPFNLYQWTLDHSHQNQITATERLSILFQDTLKMIHLRAAIDEFKAKNLMTAPVVQMLNQLILLHRFLEPSEVKNQGVDIQLYPNTDIEKELRTNFYHFYPMAYAAMNLKARKVSKQFAFFIPFLFNAEYEMKDMDTKTYPFKHPRPFNWKDKVTSLQDLSGGYLGALWGLDSTLNISSKHFKTNEALSSQFAAKPFAFMQTQYYKFFSLLKK
jgi:hypothetical protein